MASSELVYLIELIAELVIWIMKRTFDLISIVCFLVSLVMPWRLIEEMCRDFNGDWHERCFVSLALTLFDAIAIPLGVISILSPGRWVSVGCAFRNYFNNMNEKSFDLRCYFFVNGIFAIWDILCYFFIIGNLLFLTRLPIILPEMKKSIVKRFAAKTNNDVNDYQTNLNALNVLYFLQFWSAIIDVAVLIVSLPFVICAPHFWYVCICGVRAINAKCRLDIEELEARTNEYSYMTKEDIIKNTYNDLRAFFLIKIFQFLLDLIAAPCALLALMSPLRNKIFRQACAAHGVTWCICESNSRREPPPGASELQNDLVNAADEEQRNPLPSPANNMLSKQPVAPRPDDVDFMYHYEARLQALYYGFIALTDLLLFPFLVPLLLTWYRFKPVQAKLVGKTWGVEEIGIVLFQFILLMIDILVLPLVLLLFVTRLRWMPVLDKFRNDDLCSLRSIKTYCVVLYQCFLLLLDILVAPFALFVVLTNYRSATVWMCLKDNRIWHGERSGDQFYFHFVSVFETLVVLHDVFLMIPASAILFIFAYRASFTFRILYEELRYRRPRPTSPAPPPNATVIPPAPSAPPFEKVSLAPSDAELLKEKESEEYVPPVYAQSEVEPLRNTPEMVVMVSTQLESNDKVPILHPLPSTDELFQEATAENFTREWRLDIWWEFGSLLLDIPFFILGLFIFVTIWRLHVVCYRGVELQLKVYKDITRVAGAELTLNEKYAHREYYRLFRRMIGEQFLLLFLDILYLLPFVVVVCTLYRFPTTMLQIISKFIEKKPLKVKTLPPSREPNASSSERTEEKDECEPLLTCLSVKIECPDRGGPKIIMKVKRNPAAYTKYWGKSAQFSPPTARLFAQGTQMWTSVEKTFGSAGAAVGKSMLPLSLKDKVDINLTELATHLNTFGNNEVDHELGEEIELWFNIAAKNVKRTTIVKNIKKMTSKSAPVALQAEIDIKDSSTGSRSRVVLFNFTPSLTELANAIDSSSAFLSQEAVDATGERLRYAVADSKISFAVDSFGPTVLLAFFEILQDLFYTCLVFLSIISPWRFIELMRALFQSEDARYYDLASLLMKRQREAERYMIDYRAGLAPLLNEYSKQTILTNHLREGSSYKYWNQDPWYYYRYSLNFTHEQLSALERDTLARYVEIYKNIMSKLDHLEGRFGGFGLDAMVKSLRGLVYVQYRRLRIRACRTSVHVAAPEIFEEAQDNMYKSVIEVVGNKEKALWREHEKVKQDIEIEFKAMEQTALATPKTSLKYLFKRPLSESRSIIKDKFKDAMIDVAFLFMLLSLFLFIFPAVPFLSDLWRYRNSPDHTVKETIIFHVKKQARLKLLLAKFCFYSLCVILMVVGIPAYIEKLPRCESLEECIALAKRTIKRSGIYLCELLGLFVTFRTYRLTVVATIYALFVPAACIAEGINICRTSMCKGDGGRKLKFFFSVLIWFGLLAYSISVSAAAESSTHVQDIRTRVIVLFAILCSIIFLTSAEVDRILKLATKQSNTILRPFTPSWSNILAIITAPAECVQLGAIVIYFFWVTPDQYEFTDSSVHKHVSKMLLWGVPSGNEMDSLKISILLAVSLVLAWVVISSVPLAYGGSDSQRRMKIGKLTKSPAFNFCSVFVSQLFFVWIVATLLRPTSCVDGIDGPVMSTGQYEEVSCGSVAEQAWSYRISLPLLLFLCLTSTMMHSTVDKEIVHDISFGRETRDYYQADKEPSKEEEIELVEFNQFYSNVFHILQVGICVTCATGLACTERAVPLTIIAVACLLMAILPLCISDCCSLSPVPWLRSVGAILVCWTAIVCALHSRENEYPWAKSSALYIGWLIITIVGVLLVIGSECAKKAKWIKSINDSGLSDAISSLSDIAGTLTVEDSLYDSRVRNTDRLKELKQSIESATSLPVLCALIIKMESTILAERLSKNFLLSRRAWRMNLLRASYEVGNPFDDVKAAIGELRGAISGPIAMGALSRDTLSMILRRKCPEEIAWKIYSYNFDITNIMKAVAVILDSPNEKYYGDAQNFKVSIYSKLCFVNGELESFYHEFKVAKERLKKPVVLNNKTYGKPKSGASADPKPPTPAPVSVLLRGFTDNYSVQLSEKPAEVVIAKSQVEDDYNLALRLQNEQIEQDHALALTLQNETDRRNSTLL